MYENLDTTKLDSWGDVISWKPVEIEIAQKRAGKYLKKQGIPDEEIKFVQSKIKEIYDATDLIRENTSQMLDRYGKRLVKVKFSKDNRAFFTAWKGIVQDIEAYHLKRLTERKAANEQESQLVKMISNARATVLEKRYNDLRIQDRLKEAMDAGYALCEDQYRSKDSIATEHDVAARAPEIREVADIAKRVVDDKLKKILEEGLNFGTPDEE